MERCKVCWKVGVVEWEVSLATIQTVCPSVRRRCWECTVAEGGHFEHVQAYGSLRNRTKHKLYFCLISCWEITLQKVYSSFWDNQYRYLLKSRIKMSTAVDQVVACAPVTQRAWVRSPVGTSFLGEVFSGVFLSCKTNVGKLWAPRSPYIIWLSLSSILIQYGRQWPGMLTLPKTTNIQIYKNKNPSVKS